jgi:hypothetical protein
MDLNIMAAIRDDRSLPTGYHKAVLFAIASRGKKAYPNQQQLMKDAGIGNRGTLRKTVSQLEELGWLTVTKGKHESNQYKNNRYEVHPPNLSQPVTNIEQSMDKSGSLSINKDKQKNKHNEKNTKGNITWKESNLSSWSDTLV